jgi:glycosyltransferase involved in cell wall biosynthesis
LTRADRDLAGRPPPSEGELLEPHVESLDGVHLIRYGQYNGTGGASIHVEALNRELARRHAITIHQMFRPTGREASTDPWTERFDRGTIHCIPLPRPVRTSATEDGNRSAVDNRRRPPPRYRRVLRGLAILSTFGDNAATDLLRRIDGNARTVPFIPEMLPVARHLPLVATRARQLLELRADFAARLSDVLIQAGDSRVLFVNHLPLSQEALVLTQEVFRRRIPIALQHHTGWPKDRDLVFRRMRRMAYRVGAVYTRGLERHLGADAVDLGNGIDTTFFARKAGSPRGSFRSCLPGIRPDALLVLVPGHITARKRQLDILHAACLLREMSAAPDYYLAIVGYNKEPAYRQRLLRFIADHGLRDHVEIVDHLSPLELRDAYIDTDIGVLASDFEGRPRVLLEMGAMEVPVVATDAGASRDCFIDRQSGHLVPIGDPQALAEAMHDLLTDSTGRRRFGRAGSNFVRTHYSLDRLAARHARFYRSVLEVQTPVVTSPS